MAFLPSHLPNSSKSINSQANLIINHGLRELEYEKDARGSYLLMFRHNSKAYCIDATSDDGSKGRLINHSRDNANLFMKIVVVHNLPKVIFVASENISVGSEIQYDYGERRKDILKKNPWLK